MSHQKTQRHDRAPTIAGIASPSKPQQQDFTNDWNLHSQTGKGGDPESVKVSQRKRGGDKAAELVDEVLGLYTHWTKGSEHLISLRSLG